MVDRTKYSIQVVNKNLIRSPHFWICYETGALTVWGRTKFSISTGLNRKLVEIENLVQRLLNLEEKTLNLFSNILIFYFLIIKKIVYLHQMSKPMYLFLVFSIPSFLAILLPSDFSILFVASLTISVPS